MTVPITRSAGNVNPGDEIIVASLNPDMNTVFGAVNSLIPETEDNTDNIAALMANPVDAHFLANVINYGANGDGGTDDTVPIQAAIDAVETAGGGTVFFPAGDYVVTRTLTIQAHGVHLVGESRGRAGAAGGTRLMLQLATATDPGVAIGNPTVESLWNCGIRHMQLSSKSYECGDMLSLDSCRCCLVDDVTFYHYYVQNDDYATIATDCSGAYRSHSNVFQNCMIYGPQYKPGAVPCYGHCIKTRCTSGVAGVSNGGQVFQNISCSHPSSSGLGYAVYHAPDTNNRNHRFVNCVFDIAGTAGGILQGCDDCMYTNCNLDDATGGRDLLLIGDPAGATFCAGKTMYRGHIDGLVQINFNSRKIPQDIQLSHGEEVTIDTGQAQLPGVYHELRGEGAAADNLAVISGGYSGKKVTVRPAEGVGYAITIKHMGVESYDNQINDKVVCPGAVDLVLATDADFANLIHDGKLWHAERAYV